MGNGGAAGEPAPGHPEIVRVVAPNPGPMTLAGTNTYVVGADPAWVIDPGPDDRGHVERVRAVAEGRGGIGGVLLTHSHSDHSGAVELLGEGLDWGDASGRDEAAELAAALAAGKADWEGDAGRAPDSGAGEGGRIGPFLIVSTPGHTRDHVAFVLGEVCFCGDLILGEGSSIVPPRAAGGSLAAYFASLDRVEALGATLLCPGHGPWITDPAAKIAEYRDHRLDRERRLLDALDRGVRDREELLDTVWDDVPSGLRPAAALAMHAHLEKLRAEGRLPEGVG